MYLAMRAKLKDREEPMERLTHPVSSLRTQKEIVKVQWTRAKSLRAAMRFTQAIVLLGLLGPALIAQGATEEELPVRDQHLLACPNSPNCVSTMATAESQTIAPYRFQKPLYEAKALLIQIFSEFPGTELVKEEADYLHFEIRSFLFQFVDDAEFRFDEAAHTIHFRSASRSGHYDFGVNRKRMEDLRGMLEGKL